MGKFLDKFLEFKNEADATRKFALFAVVIITFGLASLSVTGIVATANWTWLSALPIIGMIVAVLGAELLATVAFIRMLTASTRWRKVAGAFIFVGLALVGVKNAENGAHVVWPDRFAESSASLAAKSGVSQKKANTADTDRPAELKLVREEIAKLEVFTKKMSAQTPEGVKEAQSEMIPRCGYTGAVDGIRAEKTESAMRSCGEQIRGEIAVLKQRETNLLGAAAIPSVDAAPAVDPAIEAINLKAQSDAAFWNWFWLIAMLCTLEGARSLSLWALITDISAVDAKRDRERSDELAELRHQTELAALLASRVTVAPVPAAPPPEPAPAAVPEPVAAPPEELVLVQPEPAPPPPPPEERSDTSQRARDAAKALAKMNRADKLENVILVNDNRQRNADRAATKVAAQ